MCLSPIEACVLDGQATIAHAGVGHGAATHHLRVEAVASRDVGAGKTVLREDAAGHIAAKAARAKDKQALVAGQFLKMLAKLVDGNVQCALDAAA